MRKILFLIWQFSWGVLQTFVGLVVFLVSKKSSVYWYHGAIACEWDKNAYVSLGAFFFINNQKNYSSNETERQSLLTEYLLHEYGHTIQSLILGPFYLLVIGIPSVLLANCKCFENRRRKYNRSYYSFLPEKSANVLSSKVLHSDYFHKI